jgi:hypothetical protein
MLRVDDATQMLFLTVDVSLIAPRHLTLAPVPVAARRRRQRLAQRGIGIRTRSRRPRPEEGDRVGGAEATGRRLELDEVVLREVQIHTDDSTGAGGEQRERRAPARAHDHQRLAGGRTQRRDLRSGIFSHLGKEQAVAHRSR